ncbi:hypothetical protein HYR99_27465 [Candidatus Poribacteria bacterium]|nr:hypothetical protein [Candidatus Poribacteria bacterium]
MSQQALLRAKDDELIEWKFVKDYAGFALQMNFLAIAALVEKARSVSDPIKRKSICLSGLQLLYSSYEDFAILLHAFRNRIKGKHLHLTIGVEDQSRTGSTPVPRILKHYKSARQMLDNFGFTSITRERLSQYLDMTEDQLEDHYRDIANSVKVLGEYQKIVKDYKNKLKHGKPVLESEVNKKKTDHVLFLSWKQQDGKPVLEFHWVNASLEQLEVATIHVAKIYIRSLEFLGLFMLNYYPDHADEFLHETIAKCDRECVEQVRALGLSSQGLT